MHVIVQDACAARESRFKLGWIHKLDEIGGICKCKSFQASGILNMTDDIHMRIYGMYIVSHV